MLELKNGILKGMEGGVPVSFIVQKGELLALTGSHRLLLLRTLLGFSPLVSGYLSIEGDLLSSRSAETMRTGFSYLPQQIGCESFSVEEMMRAPFTWHGHDTCTYSKRHLLEHWSRLHLDSSLYTRSMNDIAAPVRYRMLLATHALLRKSILFLEEPFHGQDEGDIHSMTDYLYSLTEEGSTVVLTTEETQAVLFDNYINV